MVSADSLNSIQLERQVLSGILKHNDVLIELDSFLSDKDFTNSVHSTIFSMARRMILNNEKIDKVILAEKIIGIGISFKDDIKIHDYIDNLFFSTVSKKGAVDSAKELMKLTIRRNLWENTEEIRKIILQPGEKTINELVSEVDQVYNRQINLYTNDDEPVDLYSKIESFIKDLANNPDKHSGLITPFDCWNKYLGEPQIKQAVHCIVGRTGEGKSCFLFNMVKEMAKINKCPSLYLDAEMSIDLNMLRAMSIESGVNIWNLGKGNWIKNKDLAQKVTSAFSGLDPYKGMVFYIYVPNKSIHEILSIIRRWKYRYVGRDQKCIVAYDYLKIVGTDTEKDRNEWQQLGDKVSYLNEIGHRLNICLFAAAQQNRTGQQNGKRLDDSTTIGASDRILQYSSFGAIFRRKTLDELSNHGLSWGNYLLKPIKTSRMQGEEDWNQNNIVRVVDGQNNISYEDNFINYEISSYKVIERGTYKDVMERANFNSDLTDKDQKKDGNVDL